MSVEASVECRSCRARLRHLFLDLGMSPLCESYLRPDQLNAAESFYPLRVWVCHDCFLVQLEEYVDPREIFSDYAYFSSYSDSWLAHARAYVERIVPRLGLDSGSFVVEVGSNDGYLLQYLVERGIPCLGIEPARNVAEVSKEKGVDTVTEFFGSTLARRLAAEGRRPDLIVGNNVLAQVPDLNDFLTGLRILLRPGGVVTLEFPHLSRLIQERQFDTIYHEHFSYFSLTSAVTALGRNGLVIFDVEELKSHGGSLRVYARHEEDDARPVTPRVGELREREVAEGATDLPRFFAFEEVVEGVKRDLLRFLMDAKERGDRVAGYGAPGKGNTLLNYCGIRKDLLPYTVDRSPHKQGLFLPGTHIPIYPPDKIAQEQPDYVLILPWNLRNEIVGQLAFVRDWGGRFVVAIPELEIL